MAQAPAKQSIEWPADAEIVRLGEHELAWLKSSRGPSESTMLGNLAEHELARLADLKHPERREEYIRSRWLLRHALGEAADLSRNPQGAITWPAGLVGSLTHKRGQVVAVLSPQSAVISIGIDLEAIDKVRPELATKIVSQEEAARLTEQMPLLDANERLTAAFAMKEALFKAVHPIGQEMFWFHDAEIVETSVVTSTATLRLLKDCGPSMSKNREFEGNFQKIGDEKFILAMVAIANS